MALKNTLIGKLQSIQNRQQELSQLMSQPEVIGDQNRFREYAKEYAQIEPIVQCFLQYQQQQADLLNAEEMLKEEDEELHELALAEVTEVKEKQAQCELELKKLLLPQDPDDARGVYLEVRAGTGGDEAAIFAGDLFRMYHRFAETQNWQVEIVSVSEGEQGGYKEVVARIIGKGVYGKLKFESGAHRVQRVPATESQGRIHTSACTVAILPEVEAIDKIEISTKDLKIDTFRASGAGGQHVNTTDSAIRITHLPTGIVVECQDERSQHKNKAKALSLLSAKILSEERAKQQREQAETRRSLVGSGDRSERIRTYNFPQGRVTDHRINLTLYKLNEIMEGDLQPVIESLRREHQADLLSALGE